MFCSGHEEMRRHRGQRRGGQVIDHKQNRGAGEKQKSGLATSGHFLIRAFNDLQRMLASFLLACLPAAMRYGTYMPAC
jgi:hypothetical protein